MEIVSVPTFSSYSSVAVSDIYIFRHRVEFHLDMVSTE
jgi:hypothetical protein